MPFFSTFGRRTNRCSRRWGVTVCTALVYLAALDINAQNTTTQTRNTAPQVEQVLSSYEGQKVGAIEIAGRPDVNASQLQPLLVQKVGEPFAKSKIDQSIAALKSSGKAKDVELDIRPQPDGIRVMFVLQPALYFGIYTFPGAGKFSYARLLQVSDYPPRGAYSAVDVQNTTDQLRTFFHRNGYFEAQVRSELQTDPAHGVVNVAFHITRNRRAKFGRVILNGAPPELKPKLQGELKSWWARLRGVAIRNGKSYSLKTVQKATQYLESKLIDENYLGSRVKLANAEYDPQTNHADVHFDVTHGELAHLEIQGAHLWSWTRHRLLPMYEQAGLDPEIIQEGKQNLVSYFQSKGYFDVQVETRNQEEQKGRKILYRVTKGPRHRVEDVEIVGNHSLSDRQLRGYVKVDTPGFFSLFSHGKFSDQRVRQSVDNLENAYQAEGFSSVKVVPDITKSGGNIVARFRIDEGPQNVVGSLHLDGNNHVAEDKLAPGGLNSAEGQPYSAKKVDEDRSQILAQYLRMGYLNANFRATARKMDGNPHRLEVTYHITEGPRVIISSVTTLGARST
ncbi:MAG: POTRA domain-containing protein, partial [Terriglobales bacterium]